MTFDGPLNVYAVSDQHYQTLRNDLEEWSVPWRWTFDVSGQPHRTSFGGIACILLVISPESVDSEHFCRQIESVLDGRTPVVVVKTSLHCRTPVPLRSARVTYALRFTADAAVEAVRRALSQTTSRSLGQLS